MLRGRFKRLSLSIFSPFYLFSYLQFNLRKSYLDLKMTKGPDDPDVISAYAAWQDNVKKIETLRQDMANAVT